MMKQVKNFSGFGTSLSKNSKGKLRVSVGSDSRNDSMAVELHDNYIPIVIGTITDTKTVYFRAPQEPKVYPFEDVKAAMLDFIRRMEETENITLEQMTDEWEESDKN